MKVSLAPPGFVAGPALEKEVGARLSSRSSASMSVKEQCIQSWPQTTLQANIRGRVSSESIIHSDCWKGYDGLVDVGCDKHFRINKSRHFAEKSVHISGIEVFWSFTKRRLAKFNGVKQNFEFHLKECEWRYNRTLPQLLDSLRLLASKNKDLMV